MLPFGDQNCKTELNDNDNTSDDVKPFNYSASSIETTNPLTVKYAPDDYDHVDSSLIYTCTSIPGIGADLQLFEQSPAGCKCAGGDCSTSQSCSCRNISSYNSQLLLDSIAPIYECNEDCLCSAGCCNRLVQKGPLLGLTVQRTSKGFGVVTCQAIPKGSFVCEYAGEIIGKEETRRRFEVQDVKKLSNYIVILKEHYGAGAQTTIIDPTKVGNIGRYLNHSCEPNCQVVPVRINSMVPLACVFTLRDVTAGSELTYDYGSTSLQREECDNRVPCLCGAMSCRGYLPLDMSL